MRTIDGRFMRAVIKSGSGQDGGKGSGNWGHKGRPGLRGGSGKGGGTHFRAGSVSEGFRSAFKKQERNLLNTALKSESYAEFWYNISKPHLDMLHEIGFDETQPGAIKTLYEKLQNAAKVKHSNDYKKAVKAAKRNGIRHTDTPENRAARESINQQLTDALKDGNNSRLFGGIADEAKRKQIAEAITKSIQNCDDRLLSTVNQTLPNLKVNWWDDPNIDTHKSHDCFFNETSGVINIDYTSPRFYDVDGNFDADACADSFWHEYGHFVDELTKSHAPYSYKYLPGTPYEYESSSISGPTSDHGFNQACAADADALIKSMGDTDFVASPSKDDRSPWGVFITTKSGRPFWEYTNGKNVLAVGAPEEFSDALNALIHKELGYVSYDEFFSEKYGKPLAPVWGDYFESYVTPKYNLSRTRPKFKGAEEAYRKAAENYSNAMEQWRSTHDEAAITNEYYELANQYKKREKSFERASDILDAATNGAAIHLVSSYGGHGADYYTDSTRRGRTLNQCEIFANMFSLMACGDKEGLGYVAKFTPSVYNLFMQTMEDLGNG